VAMIENESFHCPDPVGMGCACREGSASGPLASAPASTTASRSADGCRSRSNPSMKRRAEATLNGQRRSWHSCKYQAMIPRHLSR
jgi:hypothetical protein